MKTMVKIFYGCLCCIMMTATCVAQQSNELEKNFLRPPANAKPWVFWYWMHAAVSKQGITADLEAMKEVGIGGAYLMPIKDTSPAIPFQPTARQLTPAWWALVKFAMQEAKRLDLKLAMHLSDGFALAGGPWISPARSMQKLVWTKTYISNNSTHAVQLAKPEANENYYKDIAVFAYPAKTMPGDDVQPQVTASNGAKPSFLSHANMGKETFKSDTACWIQYAYEKPFTCRSIKLHTGGNNYQAHRLIIQYSNDGSYFKNVTRLESPRHGWQDTDEDVTHAIPATTAKYFRFVYNKQGSEPGSEDLDAAKWKPSLKVKGIYLSGEAVINQYESKNGSMWRVSKNTTAEQVPDSLAIPLKEIVNITGKMDNDGNLRWQPPAGSWVIVRIGHTSTGHTNATGGAGKGLECDKFNADAVTLQFNNWFAKAFEKTGPALAKEVLKIFHIDSWECGSQNWSPTFNKAFQVRRGYDIGPYLLTMTGVPVQDAATSEKVLHDVRETIAELVNDVFYTTLKKLAHAKGCNFVAESVAPTMASDGLLHYQNIDLPMGEFWLNSPTHDKPNDMLDAISGAHIYGKNIVQAEAFSTLRMDWSEHPGMLKILGDRNFALGLNKMVLHVFAHNPWMDKKPGVTLDGVGLYYQRDQTWFKQSKAWISYLARCQAVLQMGKPVVDIAVFTGEEVPRRSILPDRLVSTLPGVFGKQKLEAEQKRLLNEEQPLRQKPAGVTHSANMADPEDWVNALNGYAYDSFNPDALMKMTVKQGRVELPGGASYGVLVFPDEHPMHPNNYLMSLEVIKKIKQLVDNGAKIIMPPHYFNGIGMKDNDTSMQTIWKQLVDAGNSGGNLFFTPYTDADFKKQGIEKDIDIKEGANRAMAWTHRKYADTDIYFLSNQTNKSQSFNVHFRQEGRQPELWHAVAGKMDKPMSLSKNGSYPVWLLPGESVFYIFKNALPAGEIKSTKATVVPIEETALKDWAVQFDKHYGGPASSIFLDTLSSWTDQKEPGIKYYSGSAVYSTVYNWEKTDKKNVTIEMDSIYDIATVKVNGIDCGTIWTMPYSLDISKAFRPGQNKIEIIVTNTWHNRLIGDELLPPAKRITHTTAPFRLKDAPLLPAGLVGEVKLIFE